MNEKPKTEKKDRWPMRTRLRRQAEEREVRLSIPLEKVWSKDAEEAFFGREE